MRPSLFLRAAKLVDSGERTACCEALIPSARTLFSPEVAFFTSLFAPSSFNRAGYYWPLTPQAQRERVLALLLCHAMLRNP